jgi:hypothetical protein
MIKIVKLQQGYIIHADEASACFNIEILVTNI